MQNYSVKFKIALFLIFIFVAFFVIFYVIPAFAGDTAVPSGFKFGPFGLRFYSLALLFGALAAFLVARRYAPIFGIAISDLENLTVIAMLAGLVGARIHHVLSAWGFYGAYPLAIFQIWRGGLGFYGGLIGAAVGVGIYTRVRKNSFLSTADLLSLVLPIGYALGRWGNFFNQEIHGLPTALPWRMYVAPLNRVGEYASYDFFHPVFLYDSLWNVMVFLTLWRLTTIVNRRPPGLIFGSYLILYSIGRFYLETLRADATIVGGYRLNQLIALTAIVCGIFFFFRSGQLVKKESD